MGVKETLLNLLYPARCVVCDEITGTGCAGETICKKCREKIVYIREPFCMKCGKQLSKTEQEYCSDCQKKKHAYIQGTALYDYGSMADSVFRFKYMGRVEYARFYGRELYKEKACWLAMINPDALVPVPIHPSRKRKRGYNQAELIARELARCSGIPVNIRLIRRIGRTSPLKNLNQLEREKNLKRAFKIYKNDVKLSTIVIIDDIYTTGSTIDAMTGILHKAGIPNVYFMALTIGRGI